MVAIATKKENFKESKYGRIIAERPWSDVRPNLKAEEIQLLSFDNCDSFISVFKLFSKVPQNSVLIVDRIDDLRMEKRALTRGDQARFAEILKGNHFFNLYLLVF